ncbi:hypothetical protein Bca101_019171 [Brassica carinata]
MAATNKLIIRVLLICLLPHIVFSSASGKDNDTKAYVDSLCQTTIYQELCVRSLSPYLIELLSGRDGVGAKNNNLQRWTSTALTDAKTLVSKFEGRRLSKLESTIYGKVKNVEETTSNALAIVQHYAATRH